MNLVPPDIDISPASYKYGLKTIHTQEFYNTITKQSLNPVLGFSAPKININESELPRSTPTILTQHRSGYSSHLKSYLHRNNPTVYDSDSSPDCGQSSHCTITYIFSARPSRLSRTPDWPRRWFSIGLGYNNNTKNVCSEFRLVCIRYTLYTRKKYDFLLYYCDIVKFGKVS